MSNTGIEWTDETWNPVTGCSKRSPGCKNCYAEKFARRLKAMGSAKYKNGFSVETHQEELDRPLSWKKARMVFVNSMGDLFHEEVSLDFIKDCFEVMNKKEEHIFQVLTKNSKRLKKIQGELKWTENILMGVSIENSDYIWRRDDLVEMDAEIKFISFEPLLGSVKDCSLDNIDWVIAGGESGAKARKLKKEWIIEIRNKCVDKDIPFFFKQWGGHNSRTKDRKLEGRTWDQKPLSLVK